MSSAVYFFLGMGASLIGSYFIGMAVLRKLFKAPVTHKQLLGFTGAFLVSFVALTFFVGWVVSVNDDYNRGKMVKVKGVAGQTDSFVFSR